ncbi:hypothetical protein ACHAXT_002143 [Thalassiosira profunda]
MTGLPVVAVVATHGEDRLHLLTERALPSIAKQTVKADLVVVVSDNDPLRDPLEEVDIPGCFDAEDRSHVRVVPNSRTSGRSGTGPWNTGIMAAFAAFGKDCWVAILDDDDEWLETHLESCLSVATASSQWVVSGLIRDVEGVRKQENLLANEPTAVDFFSTNPGIQGSNLFVRTRALLGAGLFDPAKIEGLKRFYLKYAPRMDYSQRQAFKVRAAKLFDCPAEEFLSAQTESRREEQLQSWNGDQLPLNAGSLAVLPTLKAGPPCGEKRRVLVGIISSDLRRICPLLDDLDAASKSNACNFSPFVVVFANSTDGKFSELVQKEIKNRALRGHVLSRTSASVESILLLCNDIMLPPADERLPISVARTIIQVFIYNMPGLESMGAVAIIDDDKRLHKGWSPFTASGADAKGPDVLIGRDLRTPPNPSVFSLRTNLIDLLYSLDLAHVEGDGKEEVRSFCLDEDPFATFPVSNSDHPKFDWYYDLSSSRTDHLEMPVYSAGVNIEGEDFAQVLSGLLVGTPLCRDVLPVESGPTLQRGGCMVIVNRGAKSFDPLAVQQHAPFVNFSDGTTSSTRRSDSFWCKQMKNRGVSVAVDEQLFVYHDNRFDSISSPQSVRKNIVQEVFGGILCRDPKWREQYKDTRVLEMRSWLLRELLDGEMWEDEVFSVIESTFGGSLRVYKPNPADFSQPTRFGISGRFVEVDAMESNAIKKELNSDRIDKAREVLQLAIGAQDATYVGNGSEGVSFCVKDVLYKVFDRSHTKLPHKTTKLLCASYVNRPDLLPILKRSYYEGSLYRGGEGEAMIRMLREWKSKSLYHTNLSPDNLLFIRSDNTLMAIDIGRDVKYQPSEYLYFECFREMCKRAFLCFRYGRYADNIYAMTQLKQWMRDDFSSLHLVGFEAFMRLVYDSGEDKVRLLLAKLEEMNAVCGHVVTAEEAEDDESVIKRLNEVVTQKVAEGCTRIGIAIADPFHQKIGTDPNRRPLWFYRRCIRRLQQDIDFSLEEDTVVLIHPSTFEEYVGYHTFVLDFDSIAETYSGTVPCHVLIKSCPLDYQSILSDVRRSVRCLEATASFKSIVLIADESKVDGFLRQYAPIDMLAYSAALEQIKEERLVDHVLRFDGQDSSGVAELNKRWLGRACNATHSSQGQHYASTFAGFELLQGLECYESNDLVLQMDSDIILHCEDSEAGLQECIAKFDDPKLVTFPLPILSCGSAESRPMRHLDDSGKPFRFEIRCSIVHLDRIISLLPLEIPVHESSTGDSVLKRGWWHVLDYNVQKHELKSCRGSVGDGRGLFFVHPPNSLKRAETIDQLSVVSDMLSSYASSDLQKKAAWAKQLNQVNLQTLGGWLCERHESVVVAIDLSNATYGSAMRKFEYLARIRERKVFEGCGVILLDNGSSNNEDIAAALFSKGRSSFGMVFVWGSGVDLHSSVCLLPDHPLEYCLECGSYYDQTCQCYSGMAYNFDEIPCSALPACVPSTAHLQSTKLQSTKWFVSDTIAEGGLNIQIVALVACFESIEAAENVCVRIHSECLTGDVFYSMKCDCGEEKATFLHIMAEEEKASRPSVFVYIKGHEGRGAGLFNKGRSYQYQEQYPAATHVDALLAVGCQNDVRRYDAAVSFLKYKLRVKSISLFTNNPKKIDVVKAYFDSDRYAIRSMPARPISHNEKYLKEKVHLHGHVGLLPVEREGLKCASNRGESVACEVS